MNKGLLLINLGTPDKPERKDIRRYLAEFLADERVIDLPALVRYTLLYAIILPFRTPKVAEAYKSIWDKQGSPLRYHSEDLLKKMQKKLQGKYKVAFGMRYGNPSLKNALAELQDCDEITILPLYPQYSSAANGSSIEAALKQISKFNVTPSLRVIRDFHADSNFIKATADLIKHHRKENSHILFSYHGVPERHIHKSGCLEICDKCISEQNKKIAQKCYRAQCFTTTKLIAEKLQLEEREYSIGFQSRLGKTEWIKPYTDKVMQDLAAQDIKDLCVVCPSFIADCLETLEEIAIRGQEDWHAMTGGNLHVVPCLNSSDSLVEMIVGLIDTSACEVA